MQSWLTSGSFMIFLSLTAVPDDPLLSAHQLHDCLSNRENKDVWCTSPCCSNEKLTILKSTHMAQLCSL